MSSGYQCTRCEAFIDPRESGLEVVPLQNPVKQYHLCQNCANEWAGWVNQGPEMEANQ